MDTPWIGLIAQITWEQVPWGNRAGSMYVWVVATSLTAILAAVWILRWWYRSLLLNRPPDRSPKTTDAAPYLRYLSGSSVTLEFKEETADGSSYCKCTCPVLYYREADHRLVVQVAESEKDSSGLKQGKTVAVTIAYGRDCYGGNATILQRLTHYTEDGPTAALLLDVPQRFENRNLRRQSRFKPAEPDFPTIWWRIADEALGNNDSDVGWQPARLLDLSGLGLGMEVSPALEVEIEVERAVEVSVFLPDRENSLVLHGKVSRVSGTSDAPSIGVALVDDEKSSVARREISEFIISCRQRQLGAGRRGADAERPQEAGSDAAPREPSAPVAERPSTLDVHTSATYRLDRETQRPNAVKLVASGPALQDLLLDHGTAAHDRTVVASLDRLHRESVASVADLMRQLSDSQSAADTDFTTANRIVQSYLDLMKRDFDAVLGHALSQPADVDYVLRHSLELAILGMAVATDMKLDERNIQFVGMTGLVHDRGMLKVPRDVRSAPRRLNGREFREIMKHVPATAEILTQLQDVPLSVRLAAYQVHERQNGSGYPRGTTHQQIHPFAKILAVADNYLALVSARNYRAAVTPHRAVELLLQRTQQGAFDPTVVRALLQAISLFPVGSYVVLSDRRVGKVVRSNHIEYDRPVVEVVRDRAGRPSTARTLVSLAEERHLRIVDALAPDELSSPTVDEEVIRG